VPSAFTPFTNACLNKKAKYGWLPVGTSYFPFLEHVEQGEMTGGAPLVNIWNFSFRFFVATAN
jgi:hypothetical protein